MMRSGAFVAWALVALGWGLQGDGQNATASQPGTAKTEFKGFFETGIHLVVNNVMRPVPVLVDSDRPPFVAAQECTAGDAMLNDICTNCDGLKSLPHSVRSIREMTGSETDKKLKDMLHIVAFTTSAIRMTKFRGSIDFVPGAVTRLDEVVKKYGPPVEIQLFKAKALQSMLAFDGTVSWWGYVGVAASPQGAITHIFLREQEAARK
jgi:hypothetical protein